MAIAQGFLAGSQGLGFDPVRSAGVALERRRLGLEEQLQPLRMTTLQQEADLTKFQLRRAQKRAELEDEFMDMMSSELNKQKAAELDAIDEELTVRGAYEMLMSRLPADPPLAPEDDYYMGMFDPEYVGPLRPGQARGQRRLLPSGGISGQGLGMPRFGLEALDPAEVSAPTVDPQDPSIVLTPEEIRLEREALEALLTPGLRAFSTGLDG